MVDKSYAMVIYGACQSKANSRRLVTIKGKRVSIKSKSALSFSNAAFKQITRRPFLEGDLLLECDIYYPSRRNDLDESLIMDILEGSWYKNDRQIRRKIVNGYISKTNPRVIVRVSEIDWNEEDTT